MVVPPRKGFFPKLKDLDRRANAAFTAGTTRVGYDKIQDGAVVVYDDAGARQVQLGKLDSGAYDLAILDADSGVLLPSKQLLAPLIASDDDAITFSSTAGDQPLGSWVADQGPSGSVHVYTGAMLVTVSCSMECEGASPVDLWVTISLSGASTLSPSQDQGLHIRFDATSGQSATQQASREIPLTGLVPGDYTVSMAYKAASIGATPGSATASFRGLIVRAY